MPMNFCRCDLKAQHNYRDTGVYYEKYVGIILGYTRGRGIGIMGNQMEHETDTTLLLLL